MNHFSLGIELQVENQRIKELLELTQSKLDEAENDKARLIQELEKTCLENSFSNSKEQGNEYILQEKLEMYKEENQGLKGRFYGIH